MEGFQNRSGRTVLLAHDNTGRGRFVVETADSLLPIEVRTTRRPCFREAVHLRTFTIEYGERSRPGFLLHDGDLLDWMTPDVLGVPRWKVL